MSHWCCLVVHPPPSPSSSLSTRAFACALPGPYLLLITNRSLVGSFCGSHVFKAEAVDIVPCANGGLKALGAAQVGSEGGSGLPPHSKGE